VTLGIACLTPLYVTVVIDRRLTHGSQMVEDFATKAVVVCDRGAIVYSGIAQLGPSGPRMDDWIVKVLSDHGIATLSDAAKLLTVEATKAFRRLPYTASQRRHAFLLAGWQVITGPVRQPVIAVVSNALDDEWNWLGTSQPEFTIRVHPHDDPKTFSITSIGADLPSVTLNWLRRSLRNGFARGIGPRSVVRLSTAAIRSVAATNPTVGCNLLGVYVPPCSLESGRRLVLAGILGGATPTYLDIRMPFDQGTQHGPHFVCGGVGLTGVVAGSLASSSGGAV
jgi:hypothetical protein